MLGLSHMTNDNKYHISQHSHFTEVCLEQHLFDPKASWWVLWEQSSRPCLHFNFYFGKVHVFKKIKMQANNALEINKGQNINANMFCFDKLVHKTRRRVLLTQENGSIFRMSQVAFNNDDCLTKEEEDDFLRSLDWRCIETSRANDNRFSWVVSICNASLFKQLDRVCLAIRAAE